MKKLRWQLVIIFLTGIVVGFLLLGEQPNQQAFSPEPTQGGIYAEAVVGSPERLNPLLDLYNQVDRDVDRLIFSGLIRFDDHGTPYPDLAETFGVSRDGTIYNFTLRSGLRWHDGEPVTSDDVIFTINLIRDGGSVIPEDMKSFWNEVEAVALNETNMQFRLPEAYAPFLDYLTFGILPRHAFGDLTFEDLVQSPINLQPIGSGPYKFDRLIVENDKIIGVVLVRFDDYYGEKPFLDQVVFRYYPDAQAAFKAYQDGIVQGVGHITSEILPAALADPNLGVYSGRVPELSIVLFNLNKPEATYFQDAKVRKALMYGLNRQWMIDRLLNGQAIMATGPIMPGTWAYYDAIEPIAYDSDQARALLKDAGYEVVNETPAVRKKENVTLTFELLYPDDELHKAMAESIQRDWALLDVPVTLTPLPYDELVNSRLAERNYDAALVELNLSRTPDPDPYPFWDQAMATGGQNYSQWDNRIASEYLESARTTVDFQERARLYRNFQVVFNDEMPSLALFYPVYSYGVDHEIQGVQLGPIYDASDRFLNITEWFMIARRTSKATQSP